MEGTHKKNLLVFVAEGMPADAIAACGNPMVKTPNLDRLAAQSTVFHNAYCTQPLCTPGRASIFTGRYPHETCPDNEHNLSPETSCFPELAVFSHYRTAMIGKWDLGDEAFAQHGFETWRSIDESRNAHYSPGRDRSQETSYALFLREHGYEPDLSPDRRGNDPRGWFNKLVNIPESLSPDAYAAKEAKTFIRESCDQPFMLWMPFLRCKPGAFDEEDEIYDPNEMVLPENFEHDMENDPRRHPKYRLMALGIRKRRNRTPDDWKREIASYLAKVTLIDCYVGEVMDELERQGMMDDTVVVFTSDHGCMLGEHRMLGKEGMPEKSIKVPMMIRIPGMTENGGVVEAPFSHIDLVPTLLEAMGREVPDTLPGKSWFPFLSGIEPEEPQRDVMVQWNGPSGKSAFWKLWQTITEDIGPYWNGPNLVEIAQIWTDPVRTIITADGWKYTHSTLGYHELFNLRKDPGELENLAGESAYDDVIADLQAKIEKWQEHTNDRCISESRWCQRDGFVKKTVF